MSPAPISSTPAPMQAEQAKPEAARETAGSRREPEFSSLVTSMSRRFERSAEDRVQDRAAATRASAHGRPRSAVAEKQARHRGSQTPEREPENPVATVPTTRERKRVAIATGTREETPTPQAETAMSASSARPAAAAGPADTAGSVDAVPDAGAAAAKAALAASAELEAAPSAPGDSVSDTVGTAGVGVAAGTAAAGSATPTGAAAVGPTAPATVQPPGDPVADASSSASSGDDPDTSAQPAVGDPAAEVPSPAAAPTAGTGSTSPGVEPVAGASAQPATDAAAAAAAAAAGAPQPAAAPKSAPHPAAVQADTNALAAAVATAAAPQAASPVAAPHAAPAHVAPAVSVQLVAAVGPLKLSADGVQTLTMMLHPADLGSVQVRAELRDGVVSLQLIGSTDIGREALRAALPDLRRDLLDAGVNTGSLELGSGSPDTGAFSRNTPEGREAARRDPFVGLRDSTAATRPSATVPIHSSRGSRGLDVSI